MIAIQTLGGMTGAQGAFLVLLSAVALLATVETAKRQWAGRYPSAAMFALLPPICYLASVKIRSSRSGFESAGGWVAGALLLSFLGLLAYIERPSQ